MSGFQTYDICNPHRGKLLAIEVKTTGRPSPNDWKHLQRFVTEYGDDCVGGLLLHDGEHVLQVADRILAVPWWRVI